LLFHLTIFKSLSTKSFVSSMGASWTYMRPRLGSKTIGVRAKTFMIDAFTSLACSTALARLSLGIQRTLRRGMISTSTGGSGIVVDLT